MSTAILDEDHRKAQDLLYRVGLGGLQQAIATAIAEERERCAMVAEKLYEKPGWGPHYKNAAAAIADLIRKSS